MEGEERVSEAAANDMDLPSLCAEVCADELKELAARLDEQLAADAGQVWQFAQLRRRLVAKVLPAEATAGRRRAGALYEFNNIFARFYVAARNAVGQGRLGTGETMAPAYDKMLGEIKEKDLDRPIEDTSRECIFKDLPEAPDLGLVLAEIVRHEEADRVTYTFCDVSMTVPRSREEMLRSRAVKFTSQCGSDAAACAEKAKMVWLVTVLNYLLASSSLYWGFGPEVYKHAASAGAALECFASPLNHSLPVFCSPCAPLDLIYGSLGSFYDDRVSAFLGKVRQGSVVVANPPYLESELSACFTRVNELVQKGLAVVSIYPRWDDCEAVKLFRQLAGSKQDAGAAGFTVDLEAYRHAYFDYQDAKAIPARFASLGFVAGKALSEPQLASLRAIFEALACEDAGGRRRQQKRGRQ